MASSPELRDWTDFDSVRKWASNREHVPGTRRWLQHGANLNRGLVAMGLPPDPTYPSPGPETKTMSDETFDTAPAENEGQGTTDENYFNPDDELDLTGEGLQPTDADFLIVKAGVLSHEHGQRWECVFEPVGTTIEGLPNNQVRDNGFLTYDGPSQHDLAQIGKGVLKRLMTAALGTPRGRMVDLEGKTVGARVSEDNSGFARIGRYRAAK